jgi:hypothetical protein
MEAIVVSALTVMFVLPALFVVALVILLADW